jgi:sodium-dependent dicarboxylate transporter 2/3/5
MTQLLGLAVKPKMLFLAIALAISGFIGISMSDQPFAIAVTAAITILVATMWVTEALPIPVTSLVPFVAFPVSGVLTHREAAASLGNHVILLLMGAFMLSKALEKSGVHERLAYNMLHHRCRKC